ncbi:MAG: hypothetical protein QOK89_04870 [Nitrososphaeraceae archaeon]|nr:hypothetical protein [Nitrososphaeraceae archaeon]
MVDSSHNNIILSRSKIGIAIWMIGTTKSCQNQLTPLRTHITSGFIYMNVSIVKEKGEISNAPKT